MRRRVLLTGGASGIAALALVLSTGSPAAAHVHVSGSSTAAGSSSLLTFSTSHGCQTSPTTEVAIQIPQELNAATPTQLAGWEVNKVMAPLDTPITDGHGNQVTERVDQIVYVAQEPLPDGVRAAFQVSISLPEDAAATTLYFPTIQTCVEGQHDWIELPAPGQDPHDLESPAPALAVTADSGHDHDEAATESTAATETGESGTALGVTGIILGALGTVLGGAALLRSRKAA